ncbi:GNAT family N-acetyltransferase [Brevibacterium litoralis]|uniref:GNAT family N-acetyltransferase n=1 Tax=Brevibacterium litoralis TaxID=3138935 RepID=UPI0032EDD8C3
MTRIVPFPAAAGTSGTDRSIAPDTDTTRGTAGSGASGCADGADSVSVTDDAIRTRTEDLLPFLVHAMNWSLDRPHRDAAALADDPVAFGHVADWGREGDLGVIGRADDQVPAGVAEAHGAAWMRLPDADVPTRGLVSASIPELMVAVAPDHQGEGLGRQLVAAALQLARLAGHEAVSAAVDESNGAITLFEELGFTSIGRTPDDAVLLLRQV